MNSDLSHATAARRLLDHCGNLKPGEHLVILANPSTLPLARLFMAASACMGSEAKLHVEPPAAMHGQEPSSAASKDMLNAHLIICLTVMSIAHTSARKAATDAGARFLSLPDYSESVLTGEAMQADFRAQISATRSLAEALNGAECIEVRSRAGTLLQMSARGRRANACPGCVLTSGELGSPPDIETNIAPLEASANGIIVVDGSVTCPEIGLLPSFLELHVEAGAVKRACGDAKILAIWNRIFQKAADAKCRIIGELGIGLNPLASLTGNMLTDEGTLGTVHFGLGSNATIGGNNHVPFHLDCVVQDAVVYAQGRPLIDCGQILV